MFVVTCLHAVYVAVQMVMMKQDRNYGSNDSNEGNDDGKKTKKQKNDSPGINPYMMVLTG